MKITKINGPDIGVALQVSRNIFYQTIAPFAENRQIIDYFEEYLQRVGQELAAGRLTLWGAIINNCIVGVSALNTQGHITMMYVNQADWRKGIGKKLIKEMRVFAYNEYGLEEITVNVMPVWAAGFFYSCGFAPLSTTDNGIDLFIPLKIKAKKEIRYKRREISTKAVLLNVFIFLAIILATIIWYVLTLL